MRSVRGRKPRDGSEPGGESLRLESGSRVAVIGGGPAGSFFSYFLLEMAARLDLPVHVDVYESRDFSQAGPPGCNMCGGIVSESLVQLLAVEGIELPDSVVQRGIDAYMLHMDVGSVLIDTPRHEKRIGAVFRGHGPKGGQEARLEGFDGFLQKQALSKGAKLIGERVTDILRTEDGIRVTTRNGSTQDYDLVVASSGVNTQTLKIFENVCGGYRAPEVTRTFICEFRLGRQAVADHLGTSMHTFLLDIPRLEFAALIPKGDYVTVCMLGKKIDRELVATFLNAPEVRRCFPPDWQPDRHVCQCTPQMYLKAAGRTYDDRLLFIGDCGTNRLYKDGIGGAYRAAKAAASAVVFDGIGAESLSKRFARVCRALENDNRIGRIIFLFVRVLHKSALLRRAVLRMVTSEQGRDGKPRPMSTVLWDMFTGSAPYREVFLRTIKPAFLGTLAANIVKEMRPQRRKRFVKES